MAIRNVDKERLNKIPVFVKACELADLPPTLRQLSKWGMGRGLALSFKGAAKQALRKEKAATKEEN